MATLDSLPIDPTLQAGDKFPVTDQTTKQTKNVLTSQIEEYILGIQGDRKIPIEAQVDFTTAEPTFVDGVRYINTVTGTSQFTGILVAANNIYEARGTVWYEITALEGFTVWDKSLNINVSFDGTIWTNDSLTSAKTYIDAADLVLQDQVTANKVDSDASKVKTDFIAITQPVDLDVIEADVVLNNAHRVGDGTDHAQVAINKTNADASKVKTDLITIASPQNIDTMKSEIDGLTAGQTGGLKSFLTYALLQAYATPNINDSYKVTNDSNLALNGYYHWVSGTTYNLDTSLNATTFSATDNVNSGTMKATGDYIRLKNRKWVNAPSTAFTVDQLKVINSIVDIKFEGLDTSTWAGDELSIFIIAKDSPTLGNYFRIKNNTKIEYIIFDQTYVYHDGINIRTQTAYGITCTILEDFRYMDAASEYSPAIIINPSEYWSKGRIIEMSDLNFNAATTEELNILQGLIDNTVPILGVKGLVVFDIPVDPHLVNVFSPVPFIKDFKIYGFVEDEQYYISQLVFNSINGKTSININRKSDNVIVSVFYQIIPADTLQILTIPAYSGSVESFEILIDNTGMVPDTDYKSTNLYFSKYRYTSIDSRLDTSLIDYINIPNLAIFDGTMAINEGLDNLMSGSTYGGSNSGSKNTYIGIGAGVNTTLAMKNTGVGYNALKFATSGWANTAVGSEALSTGNGTGALTISGAGIEFYANVAIGEGAMALTTTGSYNCAVGTDSLTSNTTGTDNVGVGTHALNSNTDGYMNIAIGRSALRNSLHGISNIGIGYGAFMTGEGTHNIGIGSEVLKLLTIGNHNIAIGRLAGGNLTTGSSNIIIGYGIDASNATVSNELNIGNLIKGSLSGSKYVEVVGGLKFAPSTYADNASALSGGLTAGYLYKTVTGEIRIVV